MTEHRIVGDWTCACGEDLFGGTAAYSRLLAEEHLRQHRRDDRYRLAWLSARRRANEATASLRAARNALAAVREVRAK